MLTSCVVPRRTARSTLRIVAAEPERSAPVEALGRAYGAFGELAGLDRDPADRFIAATTQPRNATLATADERLLGWRGGLERQNARL